MPAPTALTSALGAVLYSPETNFGENVTTYATRLPILEAVDLSSFGQDKVDSNRVIQRRNDGTQWIRGPQGATFKTKLHLTGHGSGTGGATALTSLYTLLGFVLGTSAVSAASGTTAAAAGTAAVPTTVASGTFSAGSIARFGTGGLTSDARGQGQFGAIATHVTTNMTMLTALPAAMNAADVIGSAEMAFAADTATVTSHRFRFLTGNLQIEAHGCFATDISFGGNNAGEIPFVEITWTAAWWTFVAVTFPSVATIETFSPSPCAAGSFFFNAVGTSTRVALDTRDFSLTYKLGVAPITGPNGTSEFQTIVGAVRTPDSISISFTLDADAATATPTLAGYWDGTTEFHALYTLNPIAGAAVAFRFNRLCVMGPRPVQMDKDGLNRTKIELMAYTGTTNTNDLTGSAFIVAGA